MGRVISWASLDGVTVAAYFNRLRIPDFTCTPQFRAERKFAGSAEPLVPCQELGFRRIYLLNPPDSRHFTDSGVRIEGEQATPARQIARKLALATYNTYN